MEETRLLNIARNNDFLRNLFGPSELTIPPPAAKAVESGCESPSAIKERRAKLAIENIRAKASLKKEFMHRETEIEELFGYIDEVSAVHTPGSCIVDFCALSLQGCNTVHPEPSQRSCTPDTW